MKTERIFITPYEIVRIKGVCMKTARKELELVKKEYNKTRKQLVTIPEYSKFSGLDENDIRRIVNS